MEQLITAALSAVIGGLFGSGGIMYFMRRSIEKRLAAAEKERKDRLEQRRERYIILDRMYHALGRTLFYIIHGLKKMEKDTGTHYWNGDLQTAFESFQKAEQDKKELDRKQLAELNEE